ncbi:histidinol-phosphate transaminase [Chitinimonas sp. BJB300]|uniref:histidinol-phosphate transaminase n=1 Tax=Chitinimonas sp. BJB300 TaxID=1559339 RepID=UPI000C0E1CE0|nr:histidinol-phosphate transaminase [Chitinimonas sp. BJB300]PHV11364.1 histidinol-phosphate transaminase [Chitinimonas sp. BJB300]TSJ87462.1 histidinol-phosphate transaminase [Chitinimonas sp. BJB300]
MSLIQLAPDYIRAIAPYQPGKPIAELAREMNLDEASIVKLASNENPLGISPKARAAMLEAMDDLARYPDGNGFALKQALIGKFGVGLNQIVLGNGSNDILELVARTFLTPADSVVYSQYSFAVYPLATQAVGARGIEAQAVEYGHDLTAMLAAIQPNTKLVFIANPNNPTGTLCRPGDLVEFMTQCPPSVLVVLDEAYSEYLPRERRVDSIALQRLLPNLVICRTLSKAYGLAGLRIGFAIAAPEVADLMNRVRQPFNVNSLAQAAAVAALDDGDYLQETIRINTEGLQQISSAFVRLGVPFIPSYGNFIAFHVGDGPALNQFMLQRGVIIRPLASYGLRDSLRVSIGLPEENARFIATLEEALGG